MLFGTSASNQNSKGARQRRRRRNDARVCVFLLSPFKYFFSDLYKLLIRVYTFGAQIYPRRGNRTRPVCAIRLVCSHKTHAHTHTRSDIPTRAHAPDFERIALLGTLVGVCVCVCSRCVQRIELMVLFDLFAKVWCSPRHYDIFVFLLRKLSSRNDLI